MNVAVSPLYDPNVIVAEGGGAYPPVEAGGRFADETLVVGPDFQQAMLGFSEIDPSIYAGEVDTGLLARRPISVIGGALFDHHPERGYVHTIQRVECFMPAPAGEPVRMTGSFTGVDEHPRGWIMHAEFAFARADGQIALKVKPSALMADPDRNTAAPKPKGGPVPTAEERFATLAAEGWTEAARKTCTPERVVGYCGKTRNLIHTDPAYAQTFGFRAPITAGNQMVEWHLEAARRAGFGPAFKGEVRLARPVFWDDALSIMTRRDGQALDVAVVKQDGRVANSGRFESI